MFWYLFDELYFASLRPGGGHRAMAVFEAVRSIAAEPWSTPTRLTIVNTASEERSSVDDDDPWLSPDGRVLYFSSTRSGNAEVYEARR